MPLMMMMMMLMMRLDRQVKAHVFCSECGSVTSCQCCKLQLCKASMNPSATNALFVCCLLLVLFFIVGMMLAAVALLSQSNFKNTRDADPNTVQAIEKTVNARAPSILTYLPTYLLTYVLTY